MEYDQLLEMPYRDRRLIVFVEDTVARDIDELNKKDSGLLSDLLNNKVSWNAFWQKHKDTILDALGLASASGGASASLSLVFRVIGMATPLGILNVALLPIHWRRLARLLKYYRQMKFIGMGVHLLGIGRAQGFRLEGEPQLELVYIGHPFAKERYIPLADFHQMMIDDKFFELRQLLVHLGARDLSVEHIEGQSIAHGADITGSHEFVHPPASGKGKGKKVSESAGVGYNFSKKDRVGTTWRMSYENTFGIPHVPPDLVWFSKERRWQELAKDRMELGATGAFEVIFDYEHSLGFDANVVGKLQGVGLKLGGHFKDHGRTVWKVKGTWWNTAKTG